jgi:hypothetical protein
MLFERKSSGLPFAGYIAVLAVTGLFLPAAAHSESCGKGIDRVQAAVDAAIDRHAEKGPFSRESTFAKLGHQPTPGTVARAESGGAGWTGGEKAVAALARAREAHRAGDNRTCVSELRVARSALRRGAE